MILCVVLGAGSHRASHTLHDIPVVDVSVVSHNWQAGVEVVHLAVYEVVTGPRDSDDTSLVLNGTHFVMDNPVCYK